jgi:hypothetical protein
MESEMNCAMGGLITAFTLISRTSRGAAYTRPDTKSARVTHRRKRKTLLTDV